MSGYMIFDTSQHHIRTDRIGSRFEDWRRKDASDLQCSTQHTKSLIRDREDQLWETDRRNRNGVDPLANVVGWHLGHIDRTAWLNRKVRCYRRIRSASELRAGRRNVALRQAYEKVKAERVAQEVESGNILTAHEQSRFRAMAGDPSYTMMAQARKEAELEAARQKERDVELKNILASLATVAPAAKVPDITSAPSTYIHADRMAQMAPAPMYQLAASVTKKVESQAEVRRRKELKARRAKAAREGRPFEAEEQYQDDPRGTWQAMEYEFV